MFCWGLRGLGKGELTVSVVGGVCGFNRAYLEAGTCTVDRVGWSKSLLYTQDVASS